MRSLGAAAEFDAMRVRFRNEGRHLARFDHPGIVRVLTIFAANNTEYIVSELLDGPTLGHVLAQRGTLPADEVRNLAEALCQSLAVVHRDGILHRDVKPANIILQDRRGPVLIDFGAARDSAADMSTSLTGVLTLSYAPPEQWQTHGRIGPWTDVYALGATLFHCLRGTPPPTALERLAGASVPPVGDFAPHARHLGILINRSLTIEPSERPSIDEFLATPPPPAPQPEPAPQPVPTSRVTLTRPLDGLPPLHTSTDPERAPSQRRPTTTRSKRIPLLVGGAFALMAIVVTSAYLRAGDDSEGATPGTAVASATVAPGSPGTDVSPGLPSDPTAASGSADLQLGDRGSAVTHVQERLIQLGFLAGPADGRFGRTTENAVREFRLRVSDLTPHGRVDVPTARALDRIADITVEESGAVPGATATPVPTNTTAAAT